MTVTPKPFLERPRQSVEPSAIRTENRPDGWREAAFIGQITLEHDRRREAGRMRLAVLAGVVLGIVGVGLSNVDVLTTLTNFIIGQTAS